MNIQLWEYSLVDAYDKITVLKTGTVSTSTQGTKGQALAKATYKHCGKTGISIGWFMKIRKHSIIKEG